MTDRVVTVRLKAEVAGFKQAMTDARRESEKTAYQFDKDGKKIETTSAKLVRHAELNKQAWTVAGTALAAFGAAGLLALGFATKAAIEWETAWTGVVKTVSGTTDEMITLHDELRAMTRTLPVTHAEVAAVAEAAGQLGVETKNVAAFTRVMVDLGNTTNLTADEAATSIAQLMNVMQTAPDQVDNLGAAIVALGNNGASTERDIVEMAQRIGGAGKIIGLTEGEVLGLANALASVGIDAEAGGSSVSKIMIDIAKAVDTGSAKLDTWAEVAGKSVEEFRAAWKSDPAAALTDIIAGLGRMNDAGEDVFSTLDQLGQSDVRVTRALLAMATSGDLLADSLELGNKALKDNTALIEEAAKRYDTTASKVAVAKNSLNDAAITIGEDLLPLLAGLAEGVAGVANAFSELPEPVQSALGGLTGIVSVVLLLGGGLLVLVPRLNQTVTLMRTLKTESPGVAAGLGKVGKAVGLLSIAMTAMAASAAIPKWGASVLEGTGVATQGLLDLASGADVADTALAKMLERDGGFKEWFTGNEINSIAAAYKNLAAPSVSEGIDNVASSIFTLGQSTSTNRLQSQEFFNSIDQGLASLVQSGASGKAASALSKIASEAGTTTDAIEVFLPQYRDALAAVSSQQELTGESAQQMGAGVEQGSAEIEAATKALEEWRNGVAEADSSFISLSDAYQSVIDKNVEMAQSTADATKSAKDSWEDYYDGASVSIKDYIKQLREQTDAQAAWEENMVDLSKRVNTKFEGADRDAANALLDDLLSQGADGAPLVAAIVGASDRELEKIVDLWKQGGGDAADEFTQQFEYWRPPVITPTLNLKPAQSQYYAWVESLKGDGKYGKYASSKSQKAMATGGAVHGPGTGTSDSVFARLSNGEHVWTAREVAAAGGHGAVEAMRRYSVRGYRDGGAVMTAPAPQVVTVPVSSTHTAQAPVAIERAYFNSPGDAGMAALDRLNKKSGGR